MKSNQTLRWRWLAIAVCVAFGPATSADVDAGKAPPAAPQGENPEGTKPTARPIRDFDLETLARLGREIYRHDQLAWVATDVVFANVSRAKLQEEGGRGWVVDTSGTQPVVRFIRKPSFKISEEAAYDVVFPEGKKPQFMVPDDRTLTSHQIAARAALKTALAPFEKREYPLCQVSRGGYNPVVLDDPSHPGFLVYLLRPKDTKDSVPVGGHYRISVSADGKTMMQVDPLSASCLTLDKRGGEMPKDAKVVSLFASHVVSNTPVETHVFVAMQDKLQLYITTSDGRIWDVSGGKISCINEEPTPKTLPPQTKPGS